MNKLCMRRRRRREAHRPSSPDSRWRPIQHSVFLFASSPVLHVSDERGLVSGGLGFGGDQVPEPAPVRKK